MKIIILHGDQTIDSYNRLQKFIEVAHSRDWEIHRLTGAGKGLPEALVSDSLFKKEKLVVVEGINLLGKKDIEFLNKRFAGLDATLVIYHPGTISKTFIKNLPKITKIEEYKLPSLIWKFMDSFYPGNAKTVLQLMHEVIKKDPIEFVFVLLAKHLRSLYWAKIDFGGLPYPPWRAQKLKVQASKFKDKGLSDLISSLASADVKSKTSQAKLIDELDFIIATQLE